MNTKVKSLIAILASTFAVSLANAQGHDHDHGDHSGHDHGDHEHEGHDHDEIKAPNGGRLVDSVEPHLEFYVDDSGKVKITFLDEEGHVVAPAGQVVNVIGGDRSNPTRLRFSKSGNALVSDKALPEGNNLPIILNIKETPSSKTVRERFNLNLSECPTCDYAEYACVCEHGADDHEGHDHGHGHEGHGH
jgi:hypothetical protein